MRSRFIYGLLILLSFLINKHAHGQDPENFERRGFHNLPVSDQIYRKLGIHDGNLVRTTFLNTGQVNLFDNPPNGEWPKGSGHFYMDGIAVLIATEARDTTGQIFHSVVTEYRERTDPEPRIGNKEWGCEPLPGFAAEGQDSPALSDKPQTWPPFWPKMTVGPDSGKGVEWDGNWNGFFGLNQFQADQESYFYYDDRNDEEFAFFPDPTDSTRRGIGVLVLVRGLQWSQVLAEDVIFWLYEITNISLFDREKMAFGMRGDSGIGGRADQDDDVLEWDTLLDIAFSRDNDGIGFGGFQPLAVAGYAFLESPGNQFDNQDNDDDGIIDESRDNDAGTFTFDPNEGVANPAQFEIFYGRRPKPHWLGDEDQDWNPERDDVGRDGVRPEDPNYVGPDADGTEGNGRPDQGEPNFGRTDLDESDQLGLTSAQFFPLGEVWPKDDEQLWTRLNPGLFRTNKTSPGNIGFVFGSGLFPLPQRKIERFSMALLFGADRGDMFRNKQTVQVIFNSDYQFAKAPLKPTVTAVAGDRKVTLYWDRKAEKSFDPVYGPDFEGYAIYKSTEPSFSSPEVKSITDMFGIPTLRKPVAQFDIIDGIMGEDPVGVNGAHFNRGTDSGLQHSWTDTDVINGQTYYYAVVAYDRGYHQGLRDEVKAGAEFDPIRESIPLGLLDVAVAESPAVIQIDEAGNVVGFDSNTVGVTPRAPAAGFLPAEVDTLIHVQGPGTGRIVVEILDGPAVQEKSYEITFTDNAADTANNGHFERRTTSYSVRDLKTNQMRINHSLFIRPEDEGDVIDGFRLRIFNDERIAVIRELSGWTEDSRSTWDLVISDPPTVNKTKLAADLEIRFFDEIADTSISGLGGKKTPVPFQVWDITNNVQMEFRFNDRDNDGKVSPGDEIRPVVLVERNGRLVQLAVWNIKLQEPMEGESIPPAGGDVIRIMVSKPFRNGDVFLLKMKPQRADPELAKSQLDNIYVVPNPYIATTPIEPANNFRLGRGERRIEFVHLPSQCTIKIFTMSGKLVDTIEHDAPADDGSEFWNLRTKDGLDAAYGYYIYVVEAPGIGVKRGKFALIK